MHHYGSIPAHMISGSLATIILISNLPTTNSVGQESIYQRLVESMFKDETATTFDLTKTMDLVCDVWAACFGSLPSSQQPHKGTTYDKGKAPGNKPQQKQQKQVQRNTAIKGKGPNPQYSEKQSTNSSSLQQKKKWPFQHGGKGILSCWAFYMMREGHRPLENPWQDHPSIPPCTVFSQPDELPWGNTHHPNFERV